MTANLFETKDVVCHVMLNVNQSVDDDSYLEWYLEKLFDWLISYDLFKVDKDVPPWLKAFQLFLPYTRVSN